MTITIISNNINNDNYNRIISCPDVEFFDFYTIDQKLRMYINNKEYISYNYQTNASLDFIKKFQKEYEKTILNKQIKTIMINIDYISADVVKIDYTIKT